MIALWLVAAWVLGCLLVLNIHRRQLNAILREPVLCCPVLVLESDDWGAGPLRQAAALDAIADTLVRHRDATGRRPTFSIALVLAVPDGPVIAAGGAYARLSLDDAPFAPILSALQMGQARGVFALQLHCMEHCWPEALMGSSDPNIAQWLRQSAPASSEDLPAFLQSRWVNISHLPSTPHPSETVRSAVAGEIQAYTRIVGTPPRVVVPPTFVWTLDTERAWADGGVECIVTPGWRYTQRDAQGGAAGDEGPITSGERSGRLTYLVRTDYFEPARGRGASHALQALDRAASQGRPCVLENHRDNFIGDQAVCRHSLAELDELCKRAPAQHADLHFLSSWELACVLRDRDPRWLVTRWRERLPFWLQRLRHSGRPWKLLSLTGLTALLVMLAALLGAPRSGAHP